MLWLILPSQFLSSGGVRTAHFALASRICRSSRWSARSLSEASPMTEQLMLSLTGVNVQVWITICFVCIPDQINVQEKSLFIMTFSKINSNNQLLDRHQFF